MLNPVSMLHRGLIFASAAWAIILAVFLFDLFVSRTAGAAISAGRGAFYSLIGNRLVRVSAKRARVQRLHGLLRRVPRTAGHQARAEAPRRPGR